MATTAAKPIARPVGLLEACGDEALFGLRLSDRQAEFVRLIEAHSLTVGACGRQSGKSLIGAALLVWNLLLRPDLDAIAGGAPRWALAVANSQSQAGLVLAYARSFVERSPLLRGQLVSASETTLTFKGGRYLHALPCSDRLQRGLSASAVVLDELSHFVSNTIGPRVAERVWTAIRPVTAIYGEQARMLAISTPGDSPLFGQLYERAQAGELPGAVSFQATTREMNPRVSESFLSQERIVLGRDFEREYEAAFTEGAANFLSADELQAVTGRYHELSPSAVTDAVVSLDPAFSGDPAAWCVVGRSVENRRHLLVCRVGRWAPTRTRAERRAAKTAEQKAEAEGVVLDAVAELSREFGGAPVVSDQHLAAIVSAGLADRGVSKVVIQAWTGRLLTAAFTALRSHVTANSILLPKDEVLLSELTKVRSRARGGASAVEVPRSTASHLDSALALASAVLYLEKGARRTPARVFSAMLQARLGPSPPSTASPAPARDTRTARVYSSFDGEPSEAVLERVGQMLGMGG